MKKLKLNLANMPDIQVLSREELKKVTGGNWGSGNTCKLTASDGYAEYWEYGQDWTHSEMTNDIREKADRYAVQCGCRVYYDCGYDGWGS